MTVKTIWTTLLEEAPDSTCLFSNIPAWNGLESSMTSAWPFCRFLWTNTGLSSNRLQYWVITRPRMSVAGSHWAVEGSGTNDCHSSAADAGQINFHSLHFEILRWPLQPAFQDYLDICCAGFKKLINPRWPEVWQTGPTAALVSGWWLTAGQLAALSWPLLRRCMKVFFLGLFVQRPGSLP